ncbi:iron-sulfur protein [Pseudonocardiaceae bacterium YIM PH 21723]|nr:iron-sulfur protein [Pseudonocardiaceae bacterium YIM PH 21723]
MPCLSKDSSLGDRSVFALSESIERINASEAATQVVLGLPSDGDWLHCAELIAEPHRFTAWRETLSGWLAANHQGRAPERTANGYLLGWYLHVPAMLGSMLFRLARRVPSLRPADLAFELDKDCPYPVRIALLTGEYACLPTDSSAGLPGTTVLGDEQALAALLRTRYIGHAAQFVRAYGQTTRIGRRQLWGAATDALDGGAWYAGRYTGDEEQGVLDAALLLPDREAPLTSGTKVYSVCGPDGSRVWTRRRESCCFYFAVAGAESACVTCPRVSDVDRARRVLG